nr:polypeptide N-acetylgalactosaminyltransferase-like 6 [Odocoileus virginianus texanus]
MLLRGKEKEVRPASRRRGPGAAWPDPPHVPRPTKASTKKPGRPHPTSYRQHTHMRVGGGRESAMAMVASLSGRTPRPLDRGAHRSKRRPSGEEARSVWRPSRGKRLVTASGQSSRPTAARVPAPSRLPRQGREENSPPRGLGKPPPHGRLPPLPGPPNTRPPQVWMCGGEMFDVPCSRVGHIYRKYVPYKVPSGTSLARNLKRVAETWMDEFAEYIYQRRPEYRHLSPGDLSAQKELRRQLKCKDFKWFMAAVAWDVPKYYPPVEPPPAAWGELRNVAANLCVDSKHGATGTELRLDICVKDGSERTWSHEQLFTLGWREDIRPGEPLHTRKFCFDAVSHSSPVTLYDCHGMKGNQLWGHRKDRTLFHPVSNSCMDCNPAEKKIFMARCDPLSETQQRVCDLRLQLHHETDFQRLHAFPDLCHFPFTAEVTYWS